MSALVDHYRVTLRADTYDEARELVALWNGRHPSGYLIQGFDANHQPLSDPDQQWEDDDE